MKKASSSLGRMHCLENFELVALEPIQVQSGNYSGEDVIVRLSDRYGGSDPPQ